MKKERKKSVLLPLHKIPAAPTAAIPRNAKGSERTRLHLGMYGKLFAKIATRILPISVHRSHVLVI